MVRSGPGSCCQTRGSPTPVPSGLALPSPDFSPRAGLGPAIGLRLILWILWPGSALTPGEARNPSAGTFADLLRGPVPVDSLLPEPQNGHTHTSISTHIYIYKHRYTHESGLLNRSPLNLNQNRIGSAGAERFSSLLVALFSECLLHVASLCFVLTPAD